MPASSAKPKGGSNLKKREEQSDEPAKAPTEGSYRDLVEVVSTGTFDRMCKQFACVRARLN